MRYGVPEQSLELMESLSAGKAFFEDSFLFVSSETVFQKKLIEPIKSSDWLMAIGYPFESDHDFTPERFEKTLSAVKKRFNPSSFFAIAPEFSHSYQKHIVDRDVYYNLDVSSPIPKNLTRVFRKIDEALNLGKMSLSVSKEFTKAHRDLWLEFLGRSPMTARVRSLYANIPLSVQEGSADLRFFNAWNEANNLSACLVMDFSLPNAVSYILGAHSRIHYAPHASDALMKLTLELAKEEKKDHIYLGLGVNDGITRFKLKWGAKKGHDYNLAVWDERSPEDLKKSITNAMQSFLSSSRSNAPKAKYINELPKQRPYAMLWELEKKGKISWIGGTAHFFCYSFENSFRELFEKVDTVLFEGPLDQESLNGVAIHGQNPASEIKRVSEEFNEKEIQALERCIYGYTGIGSKFFDTATKNPPNVRHILENTAPWYAFFTLWSAWLRKEGWEDSVDMEAYFIALEMGKSVFGMEDIQEQIISLETAPYERIVRFLKSHKDWNNYKNKNIKAYLAGDLNAMPGTSAEFPTVAERVIGPRDERFRQRMRPFIEAGKSIVFVGSAHMNNLRLMLAEDGFNVKRVLPTFFHKCRNYFFSDPEIFFHGSEKPQEHNKNERVRTVLSEENLNIYLQTNTPKNFFTAEALVPEQLEHYVKAVSASKALVINDEFIAWKQEGALILVAFPTETTQNKENSAYQKSLQNAILKSIRIFQQSKCTNLILLSAHNPKSEEYITHFQKNTHFNQDNSEQWYFMDLPFKPTQKLRNMFTRAQKELTIHIENFSNEHQEITDFYLKTRDLKEGTRRIFKNLEKYSQSSPHVLTFSARDKNNTLQGFTIGDFSSPYTAFYMFAFRRKNAPPGTADLLLKKLTEEAEKKGQGKINLGLAISNGISSFKKKWNAYTKFQHCESIWNIKN